jgi:hypothetical protein
MIAIATPTDEEIQDEFKEMLPELTSRLDCRFRGRNPDLRAENVAEAVALSWQMFQSARRRGKDVTAGNLAWYAVRQVLSGRKLAGSTNLDALSDTPISRERIGTHVGLSEIGDGEYRFYRVFGDRRWKWPIVDVVGARLDLASLIDECDERDRRIIEMKLAGHKQTAIATELGVSPPAVCQRLRSLRQRWDVRGVA